MAGRVRLLLLGFLPLAIGLDRFTHVPAVWVFTSGAIAVAVLADWMRRATEQVAVHAGPAIGGLLTISFGSLAELLLAFFVLMESGADVVRAQMTGSVLGTSLLGLGLAMLAGGIRRERQSFKRERAGLLASMLILVVIALLLPAVFDAVTAARLAGPHGARGQVRVSDEHLSLAVSVVLLLLYAGNLVFTLITHRNVFASQEAPNKEAPDKEAPGKETANKETAEWSLAKALGILAAATIATAWGAEVVSGALQATATGLGVPLLFLGVVPLALIGTASDLVAGVAFGRADRMGLVMSICIGSSIQVALVIAPLLVILSWAFGKPMTLVFSNPLELFAIAGVAFIVNAVAGDGETNWFEGLLLVGVYVLLALAFFFVS